MAWKSEEDYKIETEAWQPEVDDVLEGEVLKVGVGNYDKHYMLIESEGKGYYTRECANLEYQIKVMKIEEGDLVRITYLGINEDNGAYLYKLQVWEDEEEY